MENFQKKLNKILDKYQDYERIQKYLKKLDAQLKKGYKDLDKLEKILDKQGQDVENLEGLSLKGIFHKILGSKKEQEGKERQEYLQAALKRNEHKKSLELLEYEKKILVEKLAKLKDIPTQAELLIQQRESDLMKSGTPVGMRILTIAKQIDQSRHLKREIKEAIDAGEEAMVLLAEMEQYLRSARNWGNWDMMGGRGMSSYVKHSNIDKARARLHKTQHLLNRFENELRDVYNPHQLNLSLNLDSFTRFIDIFF
ncbi:MAG TPA: hypothetical protein ENJ53_03955, partial [Phaeodactylibacter sp.]|nr:hypothetical protein [Phaeodactylibacter sp.]